jgi:hypothetical protein
MDIELCIRTNQFALMKFAMTDFANSATPYAWVATAIARSEDLAPGTRHGTNKVRAGGSDDVVSYIVSSDHRRAPLRL